MRFAATFLSSSVGIGFLIVAPPIHATPFPAQGQDATPSLGQFQIVPNPLFQPALAGVTYPGYKVAKKRLTSPVLYDPFTQIDRSAPVDAGSAAYTNGAEVGAIGSGKFVSNSSIALFPSTYTPPAPGTHVVFTQIKSFTLSGGGASIRAGAASDRPASYGEVISASGASGDPTQDFPANSFFNIYVDVILPGLGAGGGSLTLINNTPLLVENPGITSFPPKVVYIHGNPTAVPLVFQSDDPALGAHAGDTFGILTLAGHGVGFDQNNAADGKQFENEVAAETEMAVDQQYGGWAPGLTVASPEPAALSLMLLGAIGLLRRNRPA